MYRLWHFLFGWDYIMVLWNSMSGSYGTICRLRMDKLGVVWYRSHNNTHKLHPDAAAKALWLTCSPDKWGF